VTREEILADLSAYAAGLDAELSLLRRIQRLSEVQREAADSVDAERLEQIADERERLMAGLFRIEHEIRDTRHRLAANQGLAADLPGFTEVAQAHRTAGALIARIMASDEATMGAMHDAEAARREASQAVEAGEATLTAYRRVVAPALSSPSLLNRRG